MTYSNLLLQSLPNGGRLTWNTRLISHSPDARVKAKNIVENISVIDGYMVIVLALGIITFRANGNKYHLRLDLKGEPAFVHQQRLSEVATFTGARGWRSRGTGAHTWCQGPLSVSLTTSCDLHYGKCKTVHCRNQRQLWIQSYAVKLLSSLWLTRHHIWILTRSGRCLVINNLHRIHSDLCLHRMFQLSKVLNSSLNRQSATHHFSSCKRSSCQALDWNNKENILECSIFEHLKVQTTLFYPSLLKILFLWDVKIWYESLFCSDLKKKNCHTTNKPKHRRYSFKLLL